MSPNLWQETPLIYSAQLSKTLGASVFLKLENLHPSFSFKYRGISHFVKKAKGDHGDSVHLVIASGGNAGLAAACAARTLNVKCSVFIPDGVLASTVNLLKLQNAEVIIGGRHYAEALAAARNLVERESDAVMVPAYDDPLIWEGHESMIIEIARQLDQKPDAIFCSVGGGGLLGGIIVGCEKVGWDSVPIVALETIGSDCFYHSMSLNAGRFNSLARKLPSGIRLVHDDVNNVFLAHFNSFSSKASGSLGASQPAAAVVKMALERAGGVRSMSVPDELSMEALGLFANDHKTIVELACSTTLVPAYHPSLFDQVVPRSPHGKERVVVFIVCGGFKISLEDTKHFELIVNKDRQGPEDAWEVKCDNGELFRVPKNETIIE